MGKDQRQLRTEYLRQQLKLTRKAANALRVSYDNTIPILPVSKDISADDLIQLDALTSRFARLADILIQKVFRAIDAIELVDEGTLIDRLNRAEKRKFIDSVAEWRNIREIRNQIAHEYVVEDLHSLFQDVSRYSPALLSCINHIEAYLTEKEII